MFTVKEVVSRMVKSFNTPILDGTGLFMVEVYDHKGRIVRSTMAKEERTTLTKTY